MSKTLKTRPLRVRIMDSKDHKVDYSEHHDHTGGRECDLPEKNEFKHGDVETVCYYTFKYIGVNLHACDMCSDNVAIRQENRSNRHETKKKLREAVKNDDIVDEVVI